MAERPDRELVLLSLQGIKEAFGELIERYQGLVGRIALRMVGAPDAAQDVVQETMLQAYLSLRDLQKIDSFRSWLYGIALNVSKGYLREQKREKRFHGMLADEPADDDGSRGSGAANGGAALSGEQQPDSGVDGQDPQQIALERELHRLVLAAIENLPKAHREAARLYYYDSLTLHEVAAITGASMGAVKVRLHRARGHLREKLQEAYPELAAREKRGVQKERKKNMVQVKVFDILRRGEQLTVILQAEGDGRILPIWIGPAEGMAIALGLKAYPVDRPQTFDFLAHLLSTFGGALEEARVEVLKNEIFYGVARVRLGEEVKEVDARPSDVLALAVRTGSPILVADEVMEKAAEPVEQLEDKFGPFRMGQGAEEMIKEFEERMRQIRGGKTAEEGK